MCYKERDSDSGLERITEKSFSSTDLWSKMNDECRTAMLFIRRNCLLREEIRRIQGCEFRI